MTGEFREKTVKSLAANLGMSEAEVAMRLQRPWGLKQLLLGKWPNYLREERRNRAESRLEVALNIVRFVEHSGMTPEEIKTVLSKLIKGALRAREE